MNSFPSFELHSWWRVLFVLGFLVVQPLGINTDAVLLLSFRYLVLRDPLNVLQSWNFVDQSPCSWNGVACDSIDGYLRVTALSLPNCQLLGSIPSDLGMLQHLHTLDFSNNSLHGSLPVSLFNSTKLRFLDLSNNLISRGVPETIGTLQNLQFLNLSDNRLTGTLPATLTTIQNLTVVSLKNNYFSGNLPTGFQSVQVLDLSSNLVEGSLPPNFGGNNIKYLNFSYNRLSGEIPLEFAEKIPGNATVDLSFNNLTGEIPDSVIFKNRGPEYFSGNPLLCGEVTKRDCPTPPPISPPAMAVIPKTPDPEAKKSPRNKFKPGTIAAIIVGDIAGIGIIIIFFFVIYKIKTKKRVLHETTQKQEATAAEDNRSLTSPSFEPRGFSRWSCLRKSGEYEEESDTEEEEDNQLQQEQEHDKKGTLVTVDGEKKLDLDTLLKASAYILGATGSNIMYRAVLEDGSSLAVRRIGENSTVVRFKDFENQVRAIAKLVHPNLVRVRGFYWGVDEKLIIYDFVPNGSLANARYNRKVGSSPCHLPWETRLRIAKGMARGLAYLHEKKHVHANLKPSNILLGSNMEPKIGDFGLERLMMGNTSSKVGTSVRNFGSMRSTTSRECFQEPLGFSPSPSAFGVSPYLSPESLRSLKPNPKWDIYAFGVILLELLTGKVVVVDELGQGNGVVIEDQNKAMKMADTAIRRELEGQEDALLACFKLGSNCASPMPQKRPTMKEALQILDRIPSSSNYYVY